MRLGGPDLVTVYQECVAFPHGTGPQPGEIRTGFGYDVHAFAAPEAGRKLFLGGVEIPHDRGLEGHSDADVLLHAICDALLGAASLGDIGILFPNTDPRTLLSQSILSEQKFPVRLLRIEASQQLVITAIALERFKLANGEYPESL